jgi:DNA-binding response OmpR family regulator
MKKMLIVEDDRAILRGLADNFKSENFEVETASNGIMGLELAGSQSFDVIILDVMLPGINGFDVCKQLRMKGIHTPILMLTGKGEEMDKVLGLEIGADDYVTKPFSVRELIARVRALLRRQTSQVAHIAEATIGDVRFNFESQEALRGKKPLEMSAKEFEILRYFVEHEGKVITRQQLLEDVWGFKIAPTTRTVDNYILSLRKKIEKDPSNPKHLITVHTTGYKLIK